MIRIHVGISELRVSDDPESYLITHALGSCIAVMVHDPVQHIGGLLHYLLPVSRGREEKARANPAVFADTGVPLLFEQMYERGCKKRDLIVKVTGGAKLYDDHGTFDIGRKNYSVLRKIFWHNGILIKAQDVGGTRPRTARLDVGSGRVIVSSMGEDNEL